jgi:hypothetical protein
MINERKKKACACEWYQAGFMRPGVVLVSVADGSLRVLEELHTDAGRLYWR